MYHNPLPLFLNQREYLFETCLKLNSTKILILPLKYVNINIHLQDFSENLLESGGQELKKCHKQICLLLD